MIQELSPIHQLVQQCVDELRDNVEEAVQSEGTFCPNCLFEEWNEGNQTALMQRLFALTKDDPEAAMVQLHQFAKFNFVIGLLADHLGVTTAELHEEELATILQN